LSADVEYPAASLRNRKSLTALILAGLVLIGLLLLWFARKPLALNYVHRALAERGVPAQFDLTRFGFRRQRLEHIVIGDPKSPDLTADVAEVGFGLAGFTPSITYIRAQGVRVRGRLIRGRLSLGALDRLVPKSTGKAFALPEVDVDLSDVQMRLETPGGVIGIAVDGQGKLSDGFSGRLAAVAHSLKLGGCIADRPVALVNVVITARHPAIDGPLRADRIACGDAEVRHVLSSIDVALSPSLDHWNGGALLATSTVSKGDYGVAALRGRIGFEGDRTDTRAHFRLSAAGLRLADIPRRFEALSGTPLAPIAGALRQAIDAAALSINADSSVEIFADRSRYGFRLAPLTVQSASGARFDIRPIGSDGGLGWSPANGMLLAATITTSGGGFPETAARLRRSGAGISGQIQSMPYSAGDATLTLDPVRFGGSAFTARIRLDGPLADGRIEGLDLPIDGRLGRDGSLIINSACTTLGFSSLEIAGTRIGTAHLPLCPIDGALLIRRADGRLGGGATIAGAELRGQIGNAPLVLTAQRVSASIARPGFSSDGLSVRMGEGRDPTRLDIAMLTGTLAASGLVRAAFGRRWQDRQCPVADLRWCGGLEPA